VGVSAGVGVGVGAAVITGVGAGVGATVAPVACGELVGVRVDGPMVCEGRGVPGGMNGLLVATGCLSPGV